MCEQSGKHHASDCGCGQHEQKDCGCHEHGHEDCGCGQHTSHDCGCGHYHATYVCSCGQRHPVGSCCCTTQDAGCGCHTSHAPHHHQPYQGNGAFWRRFATREERVAWLEAYLRDLKAEAQAVEERIAEIRGKADA